jgi:hypothetical protein
MEWRCSVLLGMKASRIFVIDISIEEIRDDLQHWLKEAYFIAWFAAKEKESLSLHSVSLLLLEPKSTLPRNVRLVPVLSRHICDRER